MGASTNTEGGFNELNLTPLIDIVLVVLIIMMVNIPIQVEELKVKVSNPDAPKPPVPPTPDVEQLVVAVYDREAGAAPDSPYPIALNRRRMNETVLGGELARRLRATAKKQVFIDAASEVDYRAVIDVIDIAKEAGADKIGLARFKPAGPLPPTSVAPGALPRGVIVGNPTVVGGWNEAKADAVLKPIMGKINGCYSQLLSSNNKATGRVNIRVTLKSDGEFYPDPPSLQSVTDDMKDEGFQECLTQAAQTLDFPKISDDNQKTVLILYPLVFSPGAS